MPCLPFPNSCCCVYVKRQQKKPRGSGCSIQSLWVHLLPEDCCYEQNHRTRRLYDLLNTSSTRKEQRLIPVQLKPYIEVAEVYVQTAGTRFVTVFFVAPGKLIFFQTPGFHFYEQAQELI